jgi:norsolorinic acid ketoreductase
MNHVSLKYPRVSYISFTLGIGLGLVEAYLSRPNSVVIAAVRDPSSKSSAALSILPSGAGSTVVVVKLDSLSETDAIIATTKLHSDYGIDHIDTVIANAGIANYWGSALAVPLDALRDHYNVNTLGTLTLFQATWPLLERSSRPKFVFVSSTVGSISDMEKWPLQGVAYGVSKAAMNYIVRKIHIEQEVLTVFSIHPG